MGKYKMVVFTSPVEGKETEYNDWYNGPHVTEMLQTKGFNGVKRFRLKQPMGDHDTYPYLALYEIESDDLQEVFDDLAAKRETRTATDTVAPGGYRAIYEEL